MRRPFVIAALALTLVSGNANAQSHFVAPACSAVVPQTIQFTDRQHLLWYNRFWTGRCVAGMSWCFAGSPNWTDSMTRYAAQAPAARQAEATRRLCALGHLVGLEWAKDNSIRRIDTNALRSFESIFRDTRRGDIFARIDNVELLARQMLDNPR